MRGVSRDRRNKKDEAEYISMRNMENTNKVRQSQSVRKEDRRTCGQEDTNRVEDRKRVAKAGRSLFLILLNEISRRVAVEPLNSHWDDINSNWFMS